jgi:hypothetical protein
VTNVTLPGDGADEDRGDDHEEGPMHANFDAKLTIDTSDSSKVNAKGPLIWDPNAVPPTGTSCRISATITQTVGGNLVVATGNWNRNYNKGNKNWDGVVEAPNGETFQAGGASASGVITVTNPASPPQSSPWGPQAVTLV